MKEAFMQEAIRISKEMMRQDEGGPFGAVIVKNGQIMGRGWNKVTSSNDPTAHAEIVAIRDACQRLGDFRLAGCDIFTSCEPCPMCLSAIYWARIERIYYANTRKDAADAGFDDDFIYQELSRSAAQRKILAEQFMHGEALAALTEWKAKPDKVPY